MERNILWCQSSTVLNYRGERFDKRKLSKEDYRIASLTRKGFRDWSKRKGYATECRGDKTEQMIPGFNMTIHIRCGCDDLGLIYRKPFQEVIKQWAVEVATKQELEIQAEHALRLYQRIKSEEVPHTQTNGKAVTARYRKYRQQWLDLITAHSLIHQ